jgi:hypothetical protein
MKGGIFNRPECCNQPCECPVCLENKPLMRLNCNHYVCLEDIQHIINSNPRRLQKCPICRELINNYGCNGNIINVGNNQNQQPHIIPYEEGETDGEETDDEVHVYPNVNVVSDDEGYESPTGINELYGGRKRKTNSTRKHKKRKLNKTKKTTRRRKISKRKINKKRKTRKSAF